MLYNFQCYRWRRIEFTFFFINFTLRNNCVTFCLFWSWTCIMHNWLPIGTFKYYGKHGGSYKIQYFFILALQIKVIIVIYNWTNRLQKCLGYFAHRSWLLVPINWTYLILLINILSTYGYIWFILCSNQLHTSNLLKTIAFGLLFL